MSLDVPGIEQASADSSGLITLLPAQEAEVALLWGAFGNVLADGSNRSCIVRRSKSVEVNGATIYLSQDLSSRNPNPNLTPPKNFDELTDGSWPREHHLNSDGSSQLWVDPNTIINHSSNPFMQPPRGRTGSNFSNEMLFDPFNFEVVPFEDPNYSQKWEKITRWILDKLDRDSLVTFIELWAFDEGDGGSQPSIPGSPYSITELSRTHLLRADTDEEQADTYSDESRILVWNDGTDETTSGGNQEIFLGPQTAELRVYGGNEEEPVNPYSYDPLYISRLTDLLLAIRHDV